MTIPTNRVQLQKKESLAAGGDTDAAFFQQPLDPSTDCVDLHGVFFQSETGAEDKLVVIWRWGDDLTFYDVATGVETTLSSLVAGPVHSALVGLTGDDHTQYLRVDGTRASTGAQTFNAGVAIGGITGSDILISSDGVSASNTALVTAGYVGVHAGGGTLDTAYDFGGAGSGRAITADLGAVTITTTAIGETEVSALELINSTAAANSAQQYSPMSVRVGQGWAYFFGSSQEVKFTEQVEVTQGAALASGDLVWKSAINGATLVEKLRLSSAGALSVANGVIAGSTVSAPALSLNGLFVNDILLDTDAVVSSDLALVTSGYVAEHYALISSLVTDHGALTGLADDDHTQYLLATGARAVSGAMTFSAGLTMGSNTVSDILLSSDAASTSNTALVTAGYVDAHAGVTLDVAYDFGGAGVGRLITVDNGPVELTNNSVGTGTTSAILLVNNTSATNGVQKYSPLLELEGQGYTTGFAASQEVKFAIQTKPVQQTLNPTGKLSFLESVNGDAYNEIATLDTIGSLDLGGNLSAGGGVFSGTLTAQNTSNFTGNATFSSDIKHGDRILIISAAAASHFSNAGTMLAMEVTSGFDWYGRFNANAVGNIIVFPINLRVGDRIKSIIYYMYGASTGTKRVSFLRNPCSTALPTIYETTTSNTSGSHSIPQTVSPNITIAVSNHYYAQFRTGANGDRVYSVEVTYDRP